MATNPMQRSKRNSFILGMFVTLLITGAIIAILIFMLKDKLDKEQAELKASTNVYVLNQDVSSGQVITSDMLVTKTVNKNEVPSNATGDLSVINNYALRDKEGDNVYTEKDKNGEAKLYIEKSGTKYEVMQEEETENYYINRNNAKQYLELDTVPLVAKVTMKTNTIITTELLNKEDSQVTDDKRKQEYNMLVLPTDLATGDYVDVRFMLPTGQDYIVISRKEVEIPNIAGADSTDTIWMKLSEDETLAMSSAIVEAYQLSGAKMYVTKYTEAGMQKAATPTYPVNANVVRLLENDPNILTSAMNAIKNRYNVTLRNESINPQINNAGTEGQSNLKTKMEESITNSQTTRKEYLDSISGVVK